MHKHEYRLLVASCLNMIMIITVLVPFKIQTDTNQKPSCIVGPGGTQYNYLNY